LNFIGNVEGKELFGGAADVVVTDGFSGNILLKSSEAVAK
jgi:glycerol-3-phosphate acyltransferase PlsX